MFIPLESLLINYSSEKNVKENTSPDLTVVFTRKKLVSFKKRVTNFWNNYIIIIKCTAFTFLEMYFFPGCDGSLIQKFTSVW